MISDFFQKNLSKNIDYLVIDVIGNPLETNDSLFCKHMGSEPKGRCLYCKFVPGNQDRQSYAFCGRTTGLMASRLVEWLAANQFSKYSDQ